MYEVASHVAAVALDAVRGIAHTYVAISVAREGSNIFK